MSIPNDQSEAVNTTWILDLPQQVLRWRLQIFRRDALLRVREDLQKQVPPE